MIRSAAVSVFFLLFFYGCAEWDLGLDAKNDAAPPPPPVQITAYPFSDIPVPSGFSRDDSKSFVYESGSGSVKVAKIIFSGWENLDQVITFYQNEMLNNGWAPGTSIRDKIYILNYDKEGWAATVTLSSNYGKTIIGIQAGPK